MIEMNDQFGRTTSYYYDALNRLDAVVDYDGDVISSFEYDYNWNGNIVSVTDEEGNTTHYDYDKEVSPTRSVTSPST